MIENFGAFLITSLVAGISGSMAMEVVLWAIGTVGWAKADMIVALGSLITGNEKTARRVGLLLHALAGVGFAMLYCWAMVALGATSLARALALGVGFGFFHGLVVSLALVWVVAENHPIEKYREADLAIGLSHMVGHVAYGAIVGLVVGISSL